MYIINHFSHSQGGPYARFRFRGTHHSPICPGKSDLGPTLMSCCSTLRCMNSVHKQASMAVYDRDHALRWVFVVHILLFYRVTYLTLKCRWPYYLGTHRHGSDYYYYYSYFYSGYYYYDDDYYCEYFYCRWLWE